MEPLSFLVGMISMPTLALLLVGIIITVEVAYDLGFIATLTTLVFAGLSWWFGWFTLTWIAAHWMEALTAFGTYVLLGIGWTIVKWWFHVRACARNIKARLETNPDWLTASDVRPPQVSSHKSDIMRWMCWWPFSLISTLLNDPFRRMFEAIYRNLAVFLQSIADRAFSGIALPERKS